MNEGAISTELGLPGMPSAAEDVMVARNVALAELTGARLHLAHISTEGSVRMVREAKSRGLKVTAEACPHHFTITEETVRGYNTYAKMNPRFGPGRMCKRLRKVFAMAQSMSSPRTMLRMPLKKNNWDLRKRRSGSSDWRRPCH